MVACAAGRSDQPGVEANHGDKVGWSVEVGEQSTGFVQVPVDDECGGVDRFRVDHADGS